MGMRVIAFMSTKGGVGKTTACVNVAVALARKGRRVLVVDLDSNACASAYFGVCAHLDESVGQALLGQCSLDAVTKPILPGLWLVPGSPDLLALEMTLAGQAEMPQGAYALVEALAALEAGAYDYVLLDCPGGQVEMGQRALMAADEVVIPTGMSVVDLYAAAPTVKLVQDAQEFRADAGRPTLLGFLPNAARKTGVPAKLRDILDQYDLPCFTPLRASALLRTVAMAKRLEQRCVVVSRPDSPVARSYLQVAEEIDLGIAAARALAAQPAEPVATAPDESSLEGAGEPAPMAPGATATAAWRPAGPRRGARSVGAGGHGRAGESLAVGGRGGGGSSGQSGWLGARRPPGGGCC
jgi:chromosome partitioning protein